MLVFSVLWNYAITAERTFNSLPYDNLFFLKLRLLFHETLTTYILFLLYLVFPLLLFSLKTKLFFQPDKFLLEVL